MIFLRHLLKRRMLRDVVERRLVCVRLVRWPRLFRRVVRVRVRLRRVGRFGPDHLPKEPPDKPPAFFRLVPDPMLQRLS